MKYATVLTKLFLLGWVYSKEKIKSSEFFTVNCYITTWLEFFHFVKWQIGFGVLTCSEGEVV